MDRVIVYDGALPQTFDILNTNKFAMVGRAFFNKAVIGTATAVAGLACTPTSPTPDLNVHVDVGSIFTADPTDATAYGDLGIDNTSIVKQGILQTALTLAITPPVTSGFSQVYLVQAILSDVDEGLTALSYFNSANPNLPFSGPGNSGSQQFTVRRCKCSIALKAGTPAATGSQTTPAPDAGYTGLYAVTVANAQTQITSGNIVQLTSAPFFPTLPSVPGNVQNQSWVYAGTDTGAANAYVITFGIGQPVPTSYKTGMRVSFKAANANSGASTVNVNGLGVVNIRRASGVALASGDISAGQILDLTYDGTNFQMANYIGSGSITNTNTSVNIPYVADTGAQNAIIATFAPSIGAYTDGQIVSVKLANAITGACTINANGLGVKPVVLGDNTNPPYNVFVAGMDLLLEYSTAIGAFQIVNTSSGMFYRRPTANYIIYVNTSTGSDSLYDGTSATVGTGTSGPLKTIQKAINVAFGYAPSQFTITIQVAAGSYAESPSTPSFAGPNLIINGAGAGTTNLNSTTNGFSVSGPNTLLISNINVNNSTVFDTGACFNCGNGATLNTSNTSSGATAGAIFNVGSGTIIPGNHTFNGSCSRIFTAQTSGVILLVNSVFTFSAPIAVSVATCVAASAGSVYVNNPSAPPSFVNPSFVSGSKYLAEANGVVSAPSLGFNFFPGTVGGTAIQGGQYVP